MRFCFVTTFYPPYHFGGDAVFVQRLALELAERGHTVDVIHAGDAYRLLAGKRPSAPYQAHPNITIHRLEHNPAFVSPLVTHQAGVPLLDLARIRGILERGFDVIHYHNVSLVGGPGILKPGSGLKLYTLHEYWLVCPTHTLFKYGRAACTRRDCLPCTLSSGRPPQLWRLTGAVRRAVQHIDMFIAPSRFAAEKHREQGLDIPCEHIPNFVPDSGPEPPDGSGMPSAPAEPPYFLFAGRLERLKGLHTLIPLFRHYRRANLLIAGTGEEEGRLRQQAAGLENVRFVGQREAGELAQLYRRAAAVIVPSITYEVFPLVALEAASCGTPVIVRGIGGLPEVVEQGRCGIVYHTDEELVAAMDRLLDDPERRVRLGRSAYDAYRQHWTAEAHLRRYFALIERLRGAG